MPPERETLEVDVLIVGAGPAGLAAALRLSQLLKARGRSLEEMQVVVIEKSDPIGVHLVSGAVMDPIALREIVPDFVERGAPVTEAKEDELRFLTETGAIRFPLALPGLLGMNPLDNRGNYITSLGKLASWLAGLVEEAGVQIFSGFPGANVLYEGDRVVGVRTADRGVGRNGKPKDSYEPGAEIRAKVTLFTEGSRGSLTKELIARLGLQGRYPQSYATGIKEVWRLREGLDLEGHVIHTMGHPVDRETFGGGFLYGMRERMASLGFVTGLDYRNPFTDPHANFQRFKNHPFVRQTIEGGEIVSYGAKAIPEGGFYSIPKHHGSGFLIAGDSAGFLNVQRLKGIHLAMKSGILAAEAISEALIAGETDERRLSSYAERIRSSYVWEELRGVRNFRQSFESGFWRWFLFHVPLQMVTAGRGVRDPWPVVEAHTRMARRVELPEGQRIPPERKYDGAYAFDRLTDVYHSGTMHEEDQPVHLVVADPEICRTKCTEEYGNPCEYFCPAAVYEMVPDEARGGKRLRINASNCVHCKTCDIMDPYQIITWVTPEGGGGPQYKYL